MIDKHVQKMDLPCGQSCVQLWPCDCKIGDKANHQTTETVKDAQTAMTQRQKPSAEAIVRRLLLNVEYFCVVNGEEDSPSASLLSVAM